MSLPPEFTLKNYLKLKEENGKLKTELAGLLTTYSEDKLEIQHLKKRLDDILQMVSKKQDLVLKLMENIEYWKTGHNILHDNIYNITPDDVDYILGKLMVACKGRINPDDARETILFTISYLIGKDTP